VHGAGAGRGGELASAGRELASELDRLRDDGEGVEVERGGRSGAPVLAADLEDRVAEPADEPLGG
jgi:hypothetical protein